MSLIIIYEKIEIKKNRISIEGEDYWIVCDDRMS